MGTNLDLKMGREVNSEVADTSANGNEDNIYLLADNEKKNITSNKMMKGLLLLVFK